VLVSDEDWSRFWADLNSHHLRAEIESKIVGQREVALSYFVSEGLTGKLPCAIVDLGWFLNGQAAINIVLRRGNASSNSVNGYYLGLHQHRQLPAHAGSAKALFYLEAPDAGYARASEVSGRQTLIEHLVGIAPHRTVRGYLKEEGISRPVFEKAPKAVALLSEKVGRYIEEFVDSNRSLMGELAQPEAARAILNLLMKSALREPQPEWLAALAPIHVSTDQNNLDAIPLCAPWSVREHFAGWFPSQIRRRLGLDYGRPWPEASELEGPAVVRVGIKARAVVKRMVSRCSASSFSRTIRGRSLT
jgi:hypothetical protein